MKLRVRLFGKNYFAAGSPAELKVNLSDYYTSTVACPNCNASTVIYVKKGVHLNDIVTGVRCSRCECRLEKVRS
jgi:transcription elongation factor Elf1